MRKDLIRSVFAGAAALAMFAVAAHAAGPNAVPISPSAAGTIPPGVGPGPGPRRPGPGDLQRMDTRELPQILMVAAVNPHAKNDPEVQTLLDKAIADLQVMQQDDAARLLAFQQLVQAVRSGDAVGVRKAREDFNAATQKVHADARQFYQHDVTALQKTIRELIASGGVTAGTGNRPVNGAGPTVPPPAPPPAN